MIVYCTTCKGRTSHLKQTLPRNLAENHLARFVLLDYGSTDGLADYIRASHASDLESGHLIYYSFPAAAFDMAHAKNMAARCAIREGADILVTLDADNYAGEDFDQFVLENLTEGSFLSPNFPLIHSLKHGQGRPDRGYAGRLAIWSRTFVKLGGYDEFYDTWRGEDTDMIFRLQRAGHEMVHIANRYLKTIPHNASIRFREYPYAKEYENKRELKLIASRPDTVVNFGRWGLGTVRRNFGELVKLGPLPTRVFGIGMHRTATTSLHEALGLLGFDSFHWGEGEAPMIWQEMNRYGRSKTLERFDALSDLPIPLLYKKLDRAYPGSKFILTVRDEDSWVRSVERLWDHRYNPHRYLWDIYPFSHHIHTVLYGQQEFDRELFLARYRRHNAEVMEYFEDRPQDLLVFPQGRWDSLCAFLGRPRPTTAYPHSNSSKEQG